MFRSIIDYFVKVINECKIIRHINRDEDDRMIISRREYDDRGYTVLQMLELTCRELDSGHLIPDYSTSLADSEGYRYIYLGKIPTEIRHNTLWLKIPVVVQCVQQWSPEPVIDKLVAIVLADPKQDPSLGMPYNYEHIRNRLGLITTAGDLASISIHELRRANGEY